MTRARDIADLAGGGTLLTRQLFTATAGQTTFTPSAGYNPGALEVFMNGLMLLASDYTATNSSTVVLGVAANAGDEVEILTYQINTIGDTVSASNGGTITGDLTVQGTVAATTVTGDGSGLTGTGSPSIDDNGNATAITITSDENVGIGTTNPIGLLSIVDSSTGSGMELSPEIASNTNRFTNYNRTTSAYKNFRLDALQLEFQTSGNERLRIDNDGLKFNGDTAASSALTDYEEGTFTAGVETGTVGGGDGVYVKVGDMVYCGFTIGNFSNWSSGNAIVFNGLPFTSHSTNHGSNGSVFCRYISGGFPDASQVNTSATTGRMWKSGSTGWASVNHNDITNGSNAYFFVSLTYRAA